MLDVRYVLDCRPYWANELFYLLTSNVFYPKVDDEKGRRGE